MENNQELKDLVRQKYSEIALQDMATNASSCCGTGGCSTEVYNIMNDKYDDLNGYHPDADLGLGCGLPTEFAFIKEGDTVVDLGSGAGNDAFVARSITGPSGKVIGVDFTEAMLQKARINAEKLNFSNVEFRQGDIEDLPLRDDIADVVVSNCVLNLVPDKTKAFGEIYRVLKNGGHFSISDIVVNATLPESIQKAAEMYAGCVSGAIHKDDYLEIINSAGFTNIKVQKEKAIIIPEDILQNYLNPEEIAQFSEMGNIIFSITVFGEKPANKCTPGSGCC